MDDADLCASCNRDAANDCTCVQLVCCGNPEDQGHTGACTSMDAVAKRKLAAGDRLPLTRAWNLDEVERCATCDGGGCRDCVE